MPSKGSLALILPTAWAPSAYMAADGHTFRSAYANRALNTMWILKGARRSRRRPVVTHAPVNGRGPAPLGGMSASEGLRRDLRAPVLNKHV